MPLLMMVFKKMLKNKWLFLCLLLGLIISVALICSMPIYIQGALQKYLIKDMENYQVKNGIFTGKYMIFDSFNSTAPIDQTLRDLTKTDEKVLENKKVQEFYKNLYQAFARQDAYIKENVEKRIGLPILAQAYTYAISKRRLKTENPDKTAYGTDKFADIQSVSDIDKHIRLIDGRLPSKTKDGDTYEALIPESALSKLNILLDHTYILEDVRDKWGIPSVKVKPVGVFTVKDDKDPYWTLTSPDSYSESFIIDEELLRKDFLDNQPTLVSFTMWCFALDYHSMTTDRLSAIAGNYNKIKKDLNGLNYNNSISINAPCMDIINDYSKESKQLTRMLLALNVPIIIMLCLYLFMVSKLIIEYDKNEIALLISRGATRIQVVTGYLIEGLFLGGIAFVTGPLLGLVLSSILGASDGFLQFAGRKALPIHLSSEAFIYASIAVILSLVTMLVPAYSASKNSIVNLKRNISRGSRFTLWERLFIDVILIAISLYGYYTFVQRQSIIHITGTEASNIQIDPLMFLVPALFILGVGLLTLRLYPFLVKGLYFAGRKLWPPSAYVTLTLVGRTLRKYHFFMVFLIMTLAVGIFSAISARTINLNGMEKVLYANGSDMALETIWDNDANTGKSGSEDLTVKKVQYFEPPFLPFTQLKGVEHAAKVFVKDKVWVKADGKNIDGTQLMGIDPYDFGRVAWFRNGLLSSHINNYLNLLSSEPSACLISSSLSKTYKIQPGDSVQISWGNSDEAIFTVYGIIDYWPSWNPNIDPKSDAKVKPTLVVANLPYIQDHIALEPYKIWLKLKPEATSGEVYADIQNKKLSIVNLTDARQELIEFKKNPFQLAINGAMTMGFMISGLIYFFGFILYWILSIKSRTLQFGIYRAMGLSVRKIVTMIVWEQLLTSGAAVIAGTVIGLATGRLFVPFFQAAFDAYSQVPPFKVVSYLSDQIKVYLLIGAVMAAGITILGVLLSRMKINQAIKLGED